MIKKRVVLILGAGASAPYDFPVGTKLRDNIINNLENPHHSHSQALINHGCKGAQINEFRRSLQDSGRYSVDEFLEYRKEFVEIGKSAIALALNKHEKRSNLFQIKEGDWYRYFFSMLNTSFEEFSENNVSILTYNYDRSLEIYLLTALKNSYGKSEDECIEKLQKVPIIHLHGHLGAFPWENSTGRPYGALITNEEDYLLQAAKSIKIIHEGEDITNDEEFKKARELISKANKLIFLGFGFNKTNIERLFEGLKKHPHTIHGTAFNLEQGEVNRVKSIFKKYQTQYELSDKETDILLFLRQLRDFIEE